MIAPGDLVRFRGRRRSWLVLEVDGQTVTMTTGADTRTAQTSRLEGVEQAQPVGRGVGQPSTPRRTVRTLTLPRGTLPADVAVAHVYGDHECVVLVSPDVPAADVAESAHEMADELRHWLAGGEV